MKEIGHGKDYRYAHDYPEALVNQGYFPSELRERIYYRQIGDMNVLSRSD
jgi:putative ATPase